MKTYVYYWYHHMIPDIERNKINKALIDKNYFDFIELYKTYKIKSVEYGQYDNNFSSWYPMTFLPSTISVYDNNTDTIDYISVLDKENFEKITHFECECG